MKRNVKLFASAVCLFLLAFAVTGCGQDARPQTESAVTGQGPAEVGNVIKIGLSIDDLRLERWQHDRDFFIAKAQELGAEVEVQSANGDDAWTMLTTEPGPDVAPYHDRQVVGVPQHDWADWLSGEPNEAQLCRPLPGGNLKVQAVS